jgi:ADP-heptose:LPS heptosyltransferase
LATLASLLNVPGCSFVLLQPEIRERDRTTVATALALRWPGATLRDFGDTAALMAELDLVISVDTAVAHLAGAMGRPAWVLLPFVPDWRWQMHRRESVWYPTLRLYRQHRWRDWSEAVDAVRRDLVDLSSGRQPLR